MVTALTPDESFDIPWERRPDEPVRAWELFTIYRDLGPGRSWEQVLVEAHEKYDYEYSRTTVASYSSTYAWASRTTAYDDYIDRIRQQEYYAETREMARRHVAKAQATLEALMAPIEALQAKIDANPEEARAELAGQPVAKLMQQVQSSARALQPIMNAERLAHGLPTEIREGREEHVHTVDHSEERLTDIVRALGETGLLSHVLGEGATGEVVDAEVVEMDTHRPTPEADGISPRSPS